MLKREYKVSNISSEAIFAIPAMKPARVVLAIIFCLSLILFDIKFDLASKVRSVSNDMVKPVSYIIKIPSLIIESSISFFSSRANLEQQIKTLEEENLKLKGINLTLNNISNEVEKLNKLWSANKNLDNLQISKKVYLSSNEFQPLLVLGIQNGKEIKVDNSVISSQSLVGRINVVGYSTAEVMLVQDIRSSIPVVSSETSLHANLKGMGLNRQGALMYINKTADFKKGEKIYTSGLGGIFPEGLLVGEISSVQDPVDSEFLEINVAFLSTPINQDYFLIYSNE
tara:strand:+ start:2428 stop:3279 length:852 start_codon:yes stop_codon:yes gene_type:complete